MIKGQYVWGILLAIGLCITMVADAIPEQEDCNWPQFHGPRRDNLSDDVGLLERWPEGGPELLWQASGTGHGFSSVAIVGGIIYTAGNIEGNTYITALDMLGNTLWQEKNGPSYKRSYPGSRSTPTVVDGKLYHLNGDGHLVCLDAATGKRVWGLNILEEFQGRNIEWGLAESVLVDGQHVICSPGGEGISMVALDRDTGDTVWICTGVGDKPGYTSPIVVEYQGLRQIITLTSASAIGVHANTGELLWQYDHPVKYDVNIVTPRYDDGHVLLFATLARGATKLKLLVDGQKCRVEEVWRTEELDNEHGGVVLVDGYLYGHADGDHKWRHWTCLDAETGKTMYAVEGLPVKRSAALTYAEGMLYLVSDQGTVALAPTDPMGFNIVSQFDLPRSGDGPVWAHPVVCSGRLYLRHGEFLYVYDVRKKT